AGRRTRNSPGRRAGNGVRLLKPPLRSGSSRGRSPFRFYRRIPFRFDLKSRPRKALSNEDGSKGLLRKLNGSAAGCVSLGCQRLSTAFLLPSTVNRTLQGIIIRSAVDIHYARYDLGRADRHVLRISAPGLVGPGEGINRDPAAQVTRFNQFVERGGWALLVQGKLVNQLPHRVKVITKDRFPGPHDCDLVSRRGNRSKDKDQGQDNHELESSE